MVSKELFNKFVFSILFIYLLGIATSIALMETASIILFVLFLVNIIYFETKDFKKIVTTQTLILVMWTSVILLGYLFNNPMNQGLWQMSGTIKGFLVFITLFYWVQKIEDRKLIVSIKFLMGLAVFVSFYAIIQTFTGLDIIRPVSGVQTYSYAPNMWRSGGFFSMPLTYASSFGMISIIYGTLIYNNFKFTAKHFLYFIGLIAIFVSVLCTFTRGAYIAYFGTFLCLLFLNVNRKNFGLKLKYFFSGIVLFGILIFSLPHFRFRIMSIFQKSESMMDRIYLWQANWELFKDYPFFGVGNNQNIDVISGYLERIGKSGAYVGHAHNNYMQILAGNGLLGFLAFAAFILLSLYLSFKAIELCKDNFLKPLFLGCFGAQVFFHIAGLTECNFLDTEVNHIFFLTVAIPSAYYHKTQNEI